MGVKTTVRLLAGLISFIVLITACNPLELFFPPTAIPLPKPGILHFDNEMVAFDYRENFQLFEAGDPTFIPYNVDFEQLGSELVVGLADPAWMGTSTILYSTIGVFRYPILPNLDMEQLQQLSYEKMDLSNTVKEEKGMLNLNGMVADQVTCKRALGPVWYTFRDIWFEKEGSFFRISIWEQQNSQAADSFQSLEDLFLNSLIIKDNIPPFGILPTQTPAITPTVLPGYLFLHFENSEIAFDYLKGMNLFINKDSMFIRYPEIELGGEFRVGLGAPGFYSFDTYYRSISIFRREIPAGSNFEAVFLHAYEQVDPRIDRVQGLMEDRKILSVSGVDAIQFAYRVYSGEPAYELRDIWLEKEGMVYTISIWTEYTNPEDFAYFQAAADVLINSLNIK
jgi:hypothetical protein